MMDYEQLDIFSFMEPHQQEPPILLSAGQEVFLVIRADIIKCTVCNYEKSWICEENNRGYRLIKENGSYTCTWNDRLNEEAFTNYESAESKAEEYLKLYDGIILAKDIKPINTVAYSYIRDCDKREMTAFYCDLGNDMYYIKEFMTYHHISKGKKAVERFMKQQDFKYENVRVLNSFVPRFKNMYKCAEHTEWDYAECEFGYIREKRLKEINFDD